MLQRGETEFGLSRKESIHNLLFVLGFNAFGGFSVFLPSLVSTIASDTTGLQAKLRKEAREKGGSTLSFDSIKEMPLIQSVVYETLRLNPPVPIQYGRARKDFQMSSHDSVYDIKKGELLCGYQKLVMKDPKIFDEPESFKPDRFMDEKGSELLNYLYWSNGPQTGSPTVSNKQCAAKDYVVLTAALFVAYVFRRYDSITGDSSSITAVEKAKWGQSLLLWLWFFFFCLYLWVYWLFRGQGCTEIQGQEDNMWLIIYDMGLWERISGVHYWLIQVKLMILIIPCEMGSCVAQCFEIFCPLLSPLISWTCSSTVLVPINPPH